MENGLKGIPRRVPPPTGGGGLPDGNYTDVTISGGGTVVTINNNVVTFAKMQQIATDRLLGRSTAGTGNIEELSHDSSLYVSGGVVGVVASTTRQLTKVVLNGADIGTRSQMHYTDSTDTGIEWDITDDGSEIDITFSKGSWSPVGNFTLDLIAASTTSYWSIYGGQVADNTTETNRSVPWALKGEFGYLGVMSATTQSATGGLRLTVRVAAADASITLIIAAGSAAGTFSDLVNIAGNASMNRIAMKAQNLATGNSCTTGFVLFWRPTA